MGRRKGFTFLGLWLMMSFMSFARMPALFIGHGSPMNAIEANSFTKALNVLGGRLPLPRAILVVSAHWVTAGTFVTSMLKPKTIHDFYGFPQELFDVQYPAPGSPEVALMVQRNVLDPSISLDDHQWGLDHGTWSVLRHMYPEANVPIVQLSLNKDFSAEEHFRVGEQLRALRTQGVMIVGSGNIVHNLRRISWDKNAVPFDWAVEFDEWAKQKIASRDFSALFKGAEASQAARLSIPTAEHYDPLMYVLGAVEAGDEMNFEYEEIQNASISMRCVSFTS